LNDGAQSPHETFLEEDQAQGQTFWSAQEARDAAQLILARRKPSGSLKRAVSYTCLKP
jgi:hypothetical protein